MAADTSTQAMAIGTNTFQPRRMIDRMAEERISILGKIKMPHMGKPHRFPGRERNAA